MAIEPNMFADILSQNQTPATGTSVENAPNMFADLLVEEPTEEKAAVASGEWLMEDNLSTAFAFLEGATLGWSDEMGVGAAAAAISATTDETYDEAYARLKTAYDARQKDFAARQPAAAMGAEIAGAIVSPAAKIGMAGKAASGIGSMAARGVAEGAVYGAGKAKDVDSMAKEALIGGAFGGVGSTAFSGAGWLFKRKIKAPLEENGVFTPITLAADKGDSGEAFIQSFYRDVVGPSFGGKGVLRAQEEVVVAPLVLQQKAREKLLKDVTAAGKREAAEATKDLKAAISKVDSDTVLNKLDKTTRKEASQDIIKGNYSSLLGKDGEVIARKTAQIKKTIDNNNDALRLAAFADSVPVGAKKKDIARVLEADDPNIGQMRLEELWQKEGFRSIKDISFRMKPEELLVKIEKKVASDPTLSLLAGKTGVRSLVEDGLVTLVARRNPKTGRISGEDLSAVRNSFGMAAAKLSDEGSEAALMKGLYREIQGVVDGEMKKQLSGKRLTAFEGDVSAWSSQTVLRDAVTRASTKAGRRGKFTPDEYIASIKRNSSAQARRGQGPLRDQAEALAAATANQEKTVTESANTLVKKLTARRQRELTRAKNVARAEETKIIKEATMLKKQLSSDPSAAEKLAANMKRQEELKSQVTDNAEELAKINKARTLETPTWYHQMAASGILSIASGIGGAATGGGALGFGAGLGAFASSVGAAKGLVTEAAQKSIAGQTKTQGAVQKAVRQQIPYSGGMDAVEAVRGFSRAGAGLMTGER